jgi:hypothetical protein
MYSDEQVEKMFTDICAKISSGLSLKSIIEAEGKPSRIEFYRWINESEEKSTIYARARLERADHIFDEMFDIADNPSIGIKKKTTEKETGTFTEIIEGDMTEHRKLQIDTRKWALARMNPKKYGEKSELDLTSGGEKISTETTVTFINARRIIKE